ncbi:MAG TPA: hypothetical protein DEP88_08995 [Verrucomicrobiales bacterium]|jgi:WD40 repeat protein|nr:hypothetical protein [Verrucomicrobiales bacterium]HCI91162.1 hypothetical protein [Verrucomicrobiales bacterium]HCL96952.1 hypothetical protein [Verrucomicrobiales bacterium]
MRNGKPTTVSVLTFLSVCVLLGSSAADDHGSALNPLKGKGAAAQMGAATAANHLMAFNVSVGGSSVFSPDGKLYAIGKQNGSIKLRETQTANLLATMSQLEKPPEPMSAVDWRPFLAFSPDGKVLASASGYSPVTLWDVQQRKKIKTLAEPSVGYKLTFSADGTILAGMGMVGKDGSQRVTLWDARSGNVIKSLTLEFKLRGTDVKQNKFLGVYFPQSGSCVAIATVENDTSFVRILDVKTGGETVKIRAQDWALSLDGKFVVTRANVDTSGQRHRHRIWNTATGKMIKETME